MGEVKNAKVSRKKQAVPQRLSLRGLKMLTYEDPTDCWHGFARIEIAPGVYLSSECEGLMSGPGDGGDGDWDEDSAPDDKAVARIKRQFVKKLRDLGYILSEG